MKLLHAVIRPHKLQDVKVALTAIGIEGITVTEVRGHGRQKGQVERYRGSEYVIDLLSKVEIETVIPDNLVEPALHTITDAAKTGEIGDGKIFVLPVAQAIRIRTGERDEEAL